jgi:hypothetical protein
MGQAQVKRQELPYQWFVGAVAGDQGQFDQVGAVGQGPVGHGAVGPTALTRWAPG